jgi:hypothetical protein
VLHFLVEQVVMAELLPGEELQVPEAQEAEEAM